MKTAWQRPLQQKGWQRKRAYQWERQLDANVYVEEHLELVPCGLHHQFLLQRMFLHAEAMGQKEYDCAIHWGWQEPSPWDLEAEPSALELICPKSTMEEITEICWDVFQLWRSPGKLPCDGETEELLHQEILDSIKEHFWHKQVPTLLGGELSWHPASTPRHDPQANYSAQNCANYD